MRIIAIRVFFVLILTLLAAPATVLMEGCGSDNYCGGCPSDSIAPDFSVINLNGQPLATSVDIPSSGGAIYVCWSDVTFWITDQFGHSMNDICMEVLSDGFIKLSKTIGDCTMNTGEYVDGYLRTRSDAGGVVKVDFATPSFSCADLGLAAGESKDQEFFVQVSSCRLFSLARVTVTFNCI